MGVKSICQSFLGNRHRGPPIQSDENGSFEVADL